MMFFFIKAPAIRIPDLASQVLKMGKAHLENMMYVCDRSNAPSSVGKASVLKSHKLYLMNEPVSWRSW